MVDKWEIITGKDGIAKRVIVNGTNINYIMGADIEAGVATPVILNLRVMIKDFHISQEIDASTR